MGLLRAMADIVLVGAGTVRAAPTHEWTARRVHPGSAGLYRQWRAAIGIGAEQPTTLVATASGALEPHHPGLSAPDVPVVIATTPAGADRLATAGLGDNVQVEAIGAGDGVGATELIDLASSLAARLVLCEGGPHLIGDLMAAGLLDQLFLTVAPQLAGRDERLTRFGLLEGTTFGVDEAPWAELLSVRRAADHVFLRYDFEATD
jgi:riboflavin biosynthesis pyrimidine reductase